MVAEAKGKDKLEIPISTVAKALEDDFPKIGEDNVPVVKEDIADVPRVGTLSEKEAEFNNMIGAVELTDSLIGDSAMNCHYSPTSPLSPHSPYSLLGQESHSVTQFLIISSMKKLMALWLKLRP